MIDRTTLLTLPGTITNRVSWTRFVVAALP